MQRIFILITLLLFQNSGFAQKFLVDLEVGFLRFRNDSIQFESPRTVTVSTSGCTEIFSLGRTQRYEFGMRIEFLSSRLTGTEKYLVGKVYYVKIGNTWQELMKIEHQEQEIRPIALREKTDQFIVGGASSDDPVFDIRLNDNYYIVK